MTVFIKKGDMPLSVRQATKRGMAYVAAELAQAGARTGDEELLRVIPQENLPARLLDVVKALGHVSYEAFALACEADNLVNGANNLFNHQLAVYQAAQARLARYRLADGRPEVMEERQVIDEQGNPLFHEVTGEPVMETVVVQAAIAPIPVEIDQPVYDEATGEQSGSIMVPNPDTERDDEERAAAQTVIDQTPTEVIQFADPDGESTT
ncbi:hypothetical protein [Tritonibacter mobilis]|uniref:hypothetical protein n=1 Tax=Tritonibacter mobilis TaxID=379347 RepID=UPI00140261DD|nr:hypothetical protein [Tritonibacter mobilis]NHM21131.1 hypothetical protein [Tritonibacter mobilis]NHM25289.1 hypothetical protein [Tritonibacter mobilis]